MPDVLAFVLFIIAVAAIAALALDNRRGM